jgi:hypothetical protein
MRKEQMHTPNKKQPAGINYERWYKQAQNNEPLLRDRYHQDQR